MVLKTREVEEKQIKKSKQPLTSSHREFKPLLIPLGPRTQRPEGPPEGAKQGVLSYPLLTKLVCIHLQHLPPPPPVS